MAPKRLFVESILSIGLVKSPDNPDAKALIFKARTEDPPMKFVDYLNSLGLTREQLMAKARSVETKTEEKTPMSITDQIDAHYHPEDPSFQAHVSKALGSWADHQARERHIAPRYGDLQRTRAQIAIIEKGEFWSSPDGKALNALVRAEGGKPADEVLTKVAKSGTHSEGFAALSRLGSR